MKNILLKLLFLMAAGFLTTASAAVAEPGIITNFIGVLTELASGTVGSLAIAIILIFSGIKAWQNNSSTPLIWGAVAIIVIVVAPLAGPQLTSTVPTFMDLGTTP